jgi:hypothetical protein
LRGYQATVAPIQQITVASGIVFAKAANGSVLIPFPMDYGVWSERAELVMTSALKKYKATSSESSGSFEMWITGTQSPLAKEQLRQLGVQVVENVDERIEFMD